jgi:hypothetical protein
MGLNNSITIFKNIHKDKDIYVLGSGASLNFIDKSFFKNKITVCVNEVGIVYLPNTKYVLTKHHPEALRHAKSMPKSKIITSLGDCGEQYSTTPPKSENLYFFTHNINKCEHANTKDWPQGESGIYVSWSSITSAMHFAAYLGAKNIILVGHDCGELNNSSWVENYGYENAHPGDLYGAKQRNLLFENQSIDVKNKLKELYNCNIYSLNPFINFNLENVPYRGKNSIN